MTCASAGVAAGLAGTMLSAYLQNPWVLGGFAAIFVMLDFWVQWCISCKEMDRFTFTDPQVKSRLKDVVLLKADVMANNADDQTMLKRFA